MKLNRLEDRVDPGCVIRADPAGAYLFICDRPHLKGCIQVTVIGPLASMQTYVAAAEAEMNCEFEVMEVVALEHVHCSVEEAFESVKRGFTAIRMRPKGSSVVNLSRLMQDVA